MCVCVYINIHIHVHIHIHIECTRPRPRSVRLTENTPDSIQYRVSPQENERAQFRPITIDL